MTTRLTTKKDQLALPNFSPAPISRPAATHRSSTPALLEGIKHVAFDANYSVPDNLVHELMEIRSTPNSLCTSTVRDQILSRSAPGRQFVDIYHRISLGLAHFIGQRPLAKHSFERGCLAS